MADASTAVRAEAGEERDDRKSAAVARRNERTPKGARRLTRFADLRAVLRSTHAEQAMHGGEAFASGNPDHVPVPYLDGDRHRRRRAAIARYFTPKMILTRYREVIDRTSDMLIGELRAAGTARLDVMSFDLASNVVAEVLGLTETPNKELSSRLRRLLDSGLVLHDSAVVRFFGKIWLGAQLQNFYRKDVAPAMARRRREPCEDVLSHMMAENYSKRAILTECFLYGMAGMTTTRELVTMAAWHMLDDPALKATFLDASEAGQLAIVEEILRLEPIAGQIYRRISGATEGGFDVGEYTLDIRAANSDPEIVGACPHMLDFGRAERMRAPSGYMSYGDGPHRCPGAQLAAHETRGFLDKLMRVPGLRLETPPRVSWSHGVHGYELRGAIVRCDPG